MLCVFCFVSVNFIFSLPLARTVYKPVYFLKTVSCALFALGTYFNCKLFSLVTVHAVSILIV